MVFLMESKSLFGVWLSADWLVVTEVSQGISASVFRTPWTTLSMEADISSEVQGLITNQVGRVSQEAITLMSVMALIWQSGSVCLLVVLTVVSGVLSANTVF